jgi:hypothetical protein
MKGEGMVIGVKSLPLTLEVMWGSIPVFFVHRLHRVDQRKALI